MKTNIFLLIILFGFSCNTDSSTSTPKTKLIISSEEKENAILNTSEENNEEVKDSVILQEVEAERIIINKDEYRKLFKGPLLDTILEIRDLERLKLKVEIIYTGEFDSMKLVSEHDYTEIVRKERVEANINYFELWKHRADGDNYNDTLGRNFMASGYDLDRDITIMKEVILVIFRADGGQGIITQWTKMGGNKIQFKNSLNYIFNDGLFTGSWIENFYKIEGNKYILLGKTFGGDGGYTEGGIWVGVWDGREDFKIIKRLYYLLGGYSTDDFDYVFDEKTMKLKVTTKIDLLKSVISEEEVLIKIN